MQHLSETVDMLSRTVIQPDAPALSESAYESLKDSQQVDMITPFVRFAKDPEISGQKIALFSFTPAVGAIPNKNGLYGLLKIRGTWASDEEATKQAEHLIRTVDSINPILHIQVGQSVPLVKDPLYLTRETNTLSSLVQDEQDQQRLQRQEEEKREMKTIQERERALLKESNDILNGTYVQDTLDIYIQSRVKLAQLTWTLHEQERRIKEEVIPALKKAKREVKELDERHPEFKDQYYEHYMQARRDAGIRDDAVIGEGSTAMAWMKYLHEEDEKKEDDEKKENEPL